VLGDLTDADGWRFSDDGPMSATRPVTETPANDALRVNLARTAVDVVIPERDLVLLEVVAGWKGLEAQTAHMLREVHHQFVGWPQALDDLHARAMGDFSHYDRHPKGPAGIAVFCDLYAMVLANIAPDLRSDAGRRWIYYLTKVAGDADPETFAEVSPVLAASMQRFAEVTAPMPALQVAMSSHVRRLARVLTDRGDTGPAREVALALLVTGLIQVDRAYARGEDPAAWWARSIGGPLPEAVIEISHARLAEQGARLRAMSAARPLAAYAEDLLSLPDAGELARTCLDVADVARGDGSRPHAARDALRWLLEMLGRPILEPIHEVALRQVRRLASELVTTGPLEERIAVVRDVCGLLRRQAVAYPQTAQTIIEQVGRDALSTGDGALAEAAIAEILTLEFAYPDFAGFTDEWQVRVNPNHVRCIRTYLRIIEVDPVLARPLLVALVAHLRLGGVLVSDTDLFQRDISSLLAADIAPVYLYVKQLVRLFPVYHNEIGAEGALRETSTRLDELEGRRDHLFHFLRKQCHVESNSEMVAFTDEVIRFCATGDPSPLERYLPEELFAEITSAPDRDAIRAVFSALTASGASIDDLIAADPEALADGIAAARGTTEIAREEVGLLFAVRQEIVRKYRLDPGDALSRLRSVAGVPTEAVHRIEEDLAAGAHERALDGLLSALEALKGVIETPGPVEAVEDIYHKRHIAAGIPSMYGSYREPRCDAMGLTLRLEALATAVADRAIDDLNLSPLGYSQLVKIAGWLRLLLRAVRIEGFRAQGLTHVAAMLDELLETPRARLDQYLNVFWLASRNLETLVDARILSVYDEAAEQVVTSMLAAGRLHGPAGASEQEAALAISEGLERDLIAESFGLQRLDLLIGRVVRAVEDALQAGIEVLGAPAESAGSDVDIIGIDDTESSSGAVALGNKGLMLSRMTALGFPIPDGFVLTTGFVRERIAVGAEGLDGDVAARIRDEVARLEERSGARFGDPERPLLFSVRGGAPISMPGMLETYLNVGLNTEVAAGLARQPGREWAAWDAYRRLLQFWGMSCGLRRERFGDLLAAAKARSGVVKKAQLSGAGMREVALAYRQLLIASGTPLVDDPYAQLMACIAHVGRSWGDDAAETYRAELGISDNWGTAVIVQTMVFGNLGSMSGTGVVLTRHPLYETSGVYLYGDYVVQAQGDDVVAGLVETIPVSEAQRLAEPNHGEHSLERDFPAIYNGVLEVAEVLVTEQGLNHQEIEFTFEGDGREDLFILQTRDEVTTQCGELPAFVPSSELDGSLIATGIGVGGGALSGRAAHSQDELDEVAQRYPGEPRILLRRDTVPDDIPLVVQVDGLLTAIGGATSHAAVAAKRLGKTCVVGCRPFIVGPPGAPSRLGDELVRCGDMISISGVDGSVRRGAHPTTQVVVRGRAQQ
jgi:pyruvate,orthophosphate dikinase